MTGLYMPGKFQVKADTFYPHACDDIAFMAYESQQFSCLDATMSIRDFFIILDPKNESFSFYKISEVYA